MTVTVSAPDGSTVDFPDGTDAGVIHGAMMQHFGSGEAQPPASLAGTAWDVTKQLGVGAAKGVAGLIGLPGDAKSAVNSGLDWLMAKAGADPDKLAASHAQMEQSSILPTSAGVLNKVEGVTGPLPEPQTTPGKYAQTVGEFAPMAVGGPESILANVVKRAVLPGIGDEALGEKTQGSWLEPIARITGALAGGGVGAAGSKAGEMLANRSAAKAAAGELGNVPPGAVNRVAKSYEADKLDPATVAAKSAELGPEAMMMDTGRQMAGRAEAVASQPGAGQNKVLDAVESRTGEFGGNTAQRVKDTLDQTMGPSPDLVATKNAINDLVDQHATPLYKKVMDAHPVVDVPSSITNRPAVAQAMKDAVSLAKNHGEELVSPTETSTILQGPGYHIADDVTPAAKTSLAYWDYVKKSLDSRIRGMLQTGGVQALDSAEKADLSGLMAAKKALVGHLDNVTGGAYAVARKVAATKPEVDEAIKLGRSAFNTQLLPEELAEHMEGMSLPEQAGVKLGMRREVERNLDIARNDGAAARRFLDTNQNSDKIAHVFGQPAADAISRRINTENKFQTATTNISGNSRTSVRTELKKDTESPSVAAPPMANIGGVALAGLRRGAQFVSDQGMDRTRQGIADLVTRKGPAMSDLARILSNYNQAKVANAATPIGRQAKSLAAVIAAQQPSWLAQPSQPERRK